MNSTQQLTWYIKNSIPCMFLKYGDGEFNAANYHAGTNCDGTPYTKKLGDMLKESFVYNSLQENSMIGAWHDTSTRAFWEGLGNSSVNWVEYHTVLLDIEEQVTADKFELFKAIKLSQRKKIYVANPRMVRVGPVFAIDSFVQIDPSDWFEKDYEDVLDSVCAEVADDCDTLILTSAGMGAKQLVSDLHRLYPRAIFIDIGSGFDTLCMKSVSRSCSPSYEQICNYLRPLLPPGWE